ncbi:hypothetical protein [Nitrosomonas ureae]|uniref:hypothetical protein n=1 Tax=Nitrosomonas ureae TaxID=44577 RepID=UPI0015560A6D|nr:hypothetical protein [Nitrosomonas ureae]
MARIRNEAVLVSFHQHEFIYGFMLFFLGFDLTNDLTRSTIPFLCFTESPFQRFRTGQPYHHVGSSERTGFSRLDRIIE